MQWYCSKEKSYKPKSFSFYSVFDLGWELIYSWSSLYKGHSLGLFIYICMSELLSPLMSVCNRTSKINMKLLGTSEFICLKGITPCIAPELSVWYKYIDWNYCILISVPERMEIYIHMWGTLQLEVYETSAILMK